MSLIPLGFWAASGGGAGGAYELIESNILTSSASSVTFSSIPQDYKHLQIRYAARSDVAATSYMLYMRTNSDSGANYTTHGLQGNGSSVSSFERTGGYSFIRDLQISGNSAASGIFGMGVIDLLDYTSASKNTTIRSLNGNSTNITLTSGSWMNTAAVTAIELYPPGANLQSGSRFSLYGLRG